MKNPILQSRNLKVCKDNIDEIMDNFDFKKVHDVMHFLNWTWRFSTTPPTIDEIKAFAKFYLEEAALRDGPCNIGCGGFDIRKDEDNNFEILFSVSSWETMN